MERTDEGVDRGEEVRGDSPDRWIESPEGGLFFVNSLFIFPHLMVLLPLFTRGFVRGVLGRAPRPSTILDTFPLLAEFLLPRWGWLWVVPIGLVLRNLRVETKPGPRAALWGFLFLHLAALVWTVAGWLGIQGGRLPWGPP